MARKTPVDELFDLIDTLAAENEELVSQLTDILNGEADQYTIFDFLGVGLPNEEPEAAPEAAPARGRRAAAAEPEPEEAPARRGRRAAEAEPEPEEAPRRGRRAAAAEPEPEEAPARRGARRR